MPVPLPRVRCSVRFEGASEPKMASTSRDVAAANAALIDEIQLEFKEMAMLSALADRRRQTDEVSRAANQQGSPARPADAVVAVSPPGRLSSPSRGRLSLVDPSEIASSPLTPRQVRLQGAMESPALQPDTSAFHSEP